MTNRECFWWAARLRQTDRKNHQRELDMLWEGCQVKVDQQEKRTSERVRRTCEYFWWATRLRWTGRKISERARRMCECFWWAARLRQTGRKKYQRELDMLWEGCQVEVDQQEKKNIRESKTDIQVFLVGYQVKVDWQKKIRKQDGCVNVSGRLLG